MATLGMARMIKVQGSDGWPQVRTQCGTEPGTEQIGWRCLWRRGLQRRLEPSQTNRATVMAIGLRTRHLACVRWTGLQWRRHERRRGFMAMSGLGMHHACGPSVSRQQLQQKRKNQGPQRASHGPIIRPHGKSRAEYFLQRRIRSASFSHHPIDPWLS